MTGHSLPCMGPLVPLTADAVWSMLLHRYTYMCKYNINADYNALFQ